MNVQHQWRICRWALFGAALAISNVTAAASTCLAPWGAFETVSTPKEAVTGYDIGVDQNGQVTVVWSAYLGPDPDHELLLVRQRDANGGWQAIQELHRLPKFDSSYRPSDVKLGISPNGHAIVIWTRRFDPAQYGFAVRRDPVLGWGAAENMITPDMRFVRAWDVKVNNSGQALVAMRDRDNIFHRRFDPATGWGVTGAFATQRVSDSDLSGVSAAINEAGQAVLAWQDRSPVVAVFDPNRQWGNPVRFPAKGERLALRPVVALAQSGEVFMSWGSESDKPKTQQKKWKVYANRRDPALGWGVPEVLSVPDKNGRGPALAASNGRTVLVYQQGDKDPHLKTTRTLMRRYDPGVGWQAETDVTGPPRQGSRVASGEGPLVDSSPEGDISIAQFSYRGASTVSLEGDLLQSAWDSTPTPRASMGSLGIFNRFALSSTRVQAVATEQDKVMVRIRDCTLPTTR